MRCSSRSSRVIKLSRETVDEKYQRSASSTTTPLTVRYIFIFLICFPLPNGAYLFAENDRGRLFGDGGQSRPLGLMDLPRPQARERSTVFSSTKSISTLPL